MLVPQSRGHPDDCGQWTGCPLFREEDVRHLIQPPRRAEGVSCCVFRYISRILISSKCALVTAAHVVPEVGVSLSSLQRCGQVRQRPKNGQAWCTSEVWVIHGLNSWRKRCTGTRGASTRQLLYNKQKQQRPSRWFEWSSLTRWCLCVFVVSVREHHGSESASGLHRLNQSALNETKEELLELCSAAGMAYQWRSLDQNRSWKRTCESTTLLSNFSQQH